MAKFGVVKMSTVAAAGNTLNATHLLRIKERLDARGADETPEEVRSEIASMDAEAADKISHARELRDQANELLATARAEEADAEELGDARRNTLARRM